MKLILPIIASVLAACSRPIEGLWIEKHDGVLYDGYRYEGALLKFEKDSVLSYSMDYRAGDTLHFEISGDVIKFSGANPGLSGGRHQYSAKYLLTDDSLHLWYNPEHKITFFKSNSDNFKEYFLSKDGLEIKLPNAENVKFSSNYNALNIKVGYHGEAVKIFVNGKETERENIDKAIKDFILTVEEWDFYDVTTRLFIDGRIPCDYTFLILDYLAANNLRRVSFIAENDDYNPYTDFFLGVKLFLPPSKVNYVEDVRPSNFVSVRVAEVVPESF